MLKTEFSLITQEVIEKFTGVHIDCKLIKRFPAVLHSIFTGHILTLCQNSLELWVTGLLNLFDWCCSSNTCSQLISNLLKVIDKRDALLWVFVQLVFRTSLSLYLKLRIFLYSLEFSFRIREDMVTDFNVALFAFKVRNAWYNLVILTFRAAANDALGTFPDILRIIPLPNSQDSLVGKISVLELAKLVLNIFFVFILIFNDNSCIETIQFVFGH